MAIKCKYIVAHSDSFNYYNNYAIILI